MEETLEHILEQRGIKPTAIRLLILRTLREMNCAVAVLDLEAHLGTVDKSTIFRTLTLFQTHHLVHTIEDGTGQLKYALCEETCRCGERHNDLTDLHAHFFCERCQRTYCLRNLPVPTVPLPDGFCLHTASYVLKGLCPQCSKRGHHNNNHEAAE